MRISDGASLFTLHPPRPEVVAFCEPSYAIALGYGNDSVLVATESGLGLVDEACCTWEQTPGQMKFSLLDECGYVLHVEIQPGDQPMSYLLSLRLDYPEHYTVNDDIERFEMWINGEWAAVAVCVSPFTLYCGEFKLSQAENALLLAPKWYKVEIYDGDVMPLPYFIP